MDREKGTFTRYQFAENDPGSLSDNFVRAILEDRSGTLWLGTNGGGLNRLDRATGKFIRYRNDPADPASLNNNYVFCLHEDRDGNIWLGTWGGGLNRLDGEKGTFSHFTMADGLASNEILGILEDRSGNLWLMTNEGLSRFSPPTGQFRNYDVSDGLQGREFQGGACYQSQSGEMFFGGANGFNAFFPQNIFDNRYVPPVRITSFKVLNKEVKLPRPIWETAEIELSPKDFLFSFEFAALDYTAPEKNKYAYKLEGLTDDWIYTDAKHRLASFSLLPPGKYVFRVKGSNSDGIWNEKDVSLVIRVHGPWWRSWWFLSLLRRARSPCLLPMEAHALQAPGGEDPDRGRHGRAFQQLQHLAAGEGDRPPAAERQDQQGDRGAAVHRIEHGKDPCPPYLQETRRQATAPNCSGSFRTCRSSDRISTAARILPNKKGRPRRRERPLTDIRNSEKWTRRLSWTCGRRPASTGWRRRSRRPRCCPA